MTASTNAADDRPAETTGAMVESDSAATEMQYDEGRVPWFITVTWAGFMLLLVSYVVIYYVPDLRAWLDLPPP